MIRAINQSPLEAPKPKLGTQQKRLKNACVEFESVMTDYLLKSMRESVNRAEEPDQAQDVYESLFDQAVSKKMANQDHGGLADVLYKQLAPLVKEKAKKLA